MCFYPQGVSEDPRVNEDVVSSSAENVTESIDESIFFIFKDFFSAAFGLFVDVSFDSFVKHFW